MSFLFQTQVSRLKAGIFAASFAGNPHIGFLKHKEKLFVFSSKEAALRFASNPEDVMAKVEEKAKMSPELNRLLRLNLQFSCISSSSGVGIRVKHSPLSLKHLHVEKSPGRVPSDHDGTVYSFVWGFFFWQMLPGESPQPAKPIIMHDCGAQTELHPLESNIDRSYEWNEWELRRKAIKLVSPSSLDA